MEGCGRRQALGGRDRAKGAVTRVQYLSRQIQGVIELDPRRTAFFSKRGTWTWGDVGQLAEALNARLDAAGLGVGAQIGMMLRTRPACAAAIAGAVVGQRCIVTLNPMLPDAKLIEDIERLRLPAIVAERDDWDRPGVAEAVRKAGSIGLVLSGQTDDPISLVDGVACPGAGPHAPPAPEIVVSMLTSGTTGEPKRAPLRYEQMEVQLRRAARADPTRSDDDPPRLRDGVVIHHAPLVHISGMWALLGALLGGQTVHLIEKFNVPEWRDAIVLHRPATSGGPPAVLRMIFDANLPKEVFASLRALGTGTAGVDPDLVDAFLERYDLPVLATYGATEFGGGVAGWSIGTFRKYWRAKRGAAGRMNPGCEARVVDPETGEVLPLGAEGVLELRASVVGDGGSWVRTSDFARLDEEHFVWILGRADNAIIRGGFKVRPDEVVRVLEGHPAIAEAAVVGVPDPRLGEVPVAALRLREGANPPSMDEMSELVRRHLAPYCAPVALRFVEALPRTPSMKVSAPAVRALFSCGEQ